MPVAPIRWAPVAGGRILPRLHNPGEFLRVFLGFRSSPSFISWKAFDLIVQVALKVVLKICEGCNCRYVTQLYPFTSPTTRTWGKSPGAQAVAERSLTRSG